MIDSLPTPFFYSEPLITLGLEVEDNPNHIGYETGSLTQVYPYTYPEDNQVEVNQGQGYLVDQNHSLPQDYDYGGNLLPFDPAPTGYDQHQSQHHHQDQINQPDTALHQSVTYTPPCFPQAEYTLSDAQTYPPFNSSTLANPSPALQAQGKSITSFPDHSFQYDLDIGPELKAQTQVEAQAQAQAQSGNIIQIDHVAKSPTGLWTPITSSFSLPFPPQSQDSDFNYEFHPESQSLQYIPQRPQKLEYQDLTPTLAPHYPQSDSGLEVDLDLETEMTRDIYPFSPLSRLNGMGLGQSQGYDYGQGYRE
jgi:hypothetical protein